MSRSRNLLAKNHLGDFQGYCETKGWHPQELKGDFEVLRMTKKGETGVLLVHDRLDATVHYTTGGHAYNLAREFYKSRKVAPIDRVLSEL